MAATTGLLIGFRSHLDKAHIALVYLMVVLGGVASAGRALGLTLAAVGFVLFNLLFLPPYNTFALADPLDWLVLVAFLAVSAVVAELLDRLKREAEEARARAGEIDRLSQLGAETLKAARADEAVTTVAEMI